MLQRLVFLLIFWAIAAFLFFLYILGQKTFSLSVLVERAETRTHDQPNIVFILADDYGFHDIGYHGSKIRTPNLDRLAASGVKLENYYVRPLCSPTRAQLLTGRHPIHLGLQHKILGESQPAGLPLTTPTLAEELKALGYRTHMVGKWHLGFFKEEYLPHHRGFDTFLGCLCGFGNHYNHTLNYMGKPYLDLRDNLGPVTSEEGHYSTHLYTEKAVNLIRSHDDQKPMFLYLSYQAVHKPMQVPDKYIQQYTYIEDKSRQIYAGMVSAMDEGVANVTKALEEAGLWENTLLVFSSDNGGRRKFGGNNYPLRGEKFTLWEGAVRAIGFLTGGNRLGLPKGRVSTELIDVADWFPTFIGLAGGGVKAADGLNGFDQWETIRSGGPIKRDSILHNIDPMARHGKALYNDTFDTSISAAIRVGDYKLLTGNPGIPKVFTAPEDNLQDVEEAVYDKEKNVWLFNVGTDPSEEKDLSEEKPQLVRDILNLLDVYHKGATEPWFPSDDNKSNPELHGGVWGPWL